MLKKIKQYEIEGKFDVDINDDPETIVLMPDKVDYLAKKLKTRIATKIANRVAVWYYEREIKRKNFVSCFFFKCFVEKKITSNMLMDLPDVVFFKFW